MPFRYSDADVKQAIAKIDDALAALRALETSQDDESDVEAHGLPSSQERLKEAVAKIEEALTALRDEDAREDVDPDVEAHAAGSI